MQIKVSKTFANFINAVARTAGKQFSASLVRLSPSEYSYTVGDVFDAEASGDWDYNASKAVAIRVDYPSDFFACPVYLSTARLNAEGRRRGVRDVAGLSAMLVDMLEI